MEGYSEILQTLLKRRGLTEKESIESFLHPSYTDHLHDPFLMAGMQEAVDRVLVAIERGEKIAIYSDFDADGIPAGVILHDFFTKIGYENFVNYIPHRFTEGYGFHKEAIEKLVKDGAQVIITVDVGITAVEQVAYANELGVDVIITDHHEPLKDLPQALAVLNPKQSHCEYPFDGLCGSGVAYKLVQALVLQVKDMKEKGLPNVYKDMRSLPEGWEKWLLDLVAIATVADMVPLTGENRALVHWGLHVLHKSPRVGIRALCHKLRINQRLLNENDIGFSIGPRINAASRMGCPEDAFSLLATKDLAEAEALASKLESLNNKRKGAVAAIVRQAKGKVTQKQEDKEEDGETSVIVTGDPSWNPALVGLAAGSIADSLGRVACVWGREGTGTLKGSCRSGGAGSVVAMFEEAGDALLYYGGHHAAGGFAVADDNVHTLEDVLSTAFNSVQERVGAQEKKVVEADIEVTLAQANQSLHRELVQLSPFGIDNPKPILTIKGVHIHTVRHFGKEQNHIEVQVKDSAGYMRKISKFFATASSFTTDVAEGCIVDVLVNIEESAFAGRRTLELRIVDIV